MVTSVNKGSVLSNMESFTFGVFADVHYSPGKVYGNRFCKDSLRKLKTCIEWFNRKSPSFIVSLGDLIDGEDDKNIQLSCLSKVNEVLAEFNGDVHFVLGNHDLEMLTKEEYIGNCRTAHPKSCYSFEKGNYHFIILDGNYRKDGVEYANGNYSWTDTYINRLQIEWLIKDLSEVQRKKIIVFIHQNIDERLVNNSVDPHIIENAGEIRNILERSGKVIAVFQGHYHNGYYQKINGIHYFTEQAMVVGEGTGDGSYHIITMLHDNQILIEDCSGNKKLL